jgi:hypothetical protein
MSENEQSQEVVEEKVAKAKVKKTHTGDLIHDIAAEVEHLTKDKALKQADSLAEDIETNYFKLGGILNKIQEQGWYEGFGTFQEYAEEKFGIKDRTIRYMIRIYKDLVEKQIPWEKVAHLGWTKLKELSGVFKVNEDGTDNVDEWVEKAEKLTVKELQALLKQEGGDDETSGKQTTQITVLKFKLINDQTDTVQSALAKAKGEVSTDHDEVALESICGAYLGNAITIQKQEAATDLVEALKALSWEDALNLLDASHPELKIAVTVGDDIQVDVKAA